MKQQQAEIFDQALQSLKKGTSLPEVLLAYPEHKEELNNLLQTSQMLNALPKKNTPEPAMQRRFVLAPTRKIWFAWLQVSKFASMSVGIVLLLTALAGTSYAAYQSVPGQTLFSIKKTAEKMRVRMATNPVQKASLQMAITQERLQDAEQALNNPERNQNQVVAALTELSVETKNTIEAVNTVAKSNPVSQDSHPIVSSLDNLSKKQQALLKDIKQDITASPATSNILAQLKDNESAVQKMVAASNGDTTLTTLSSTSTPDGQNKATSTQGTIKGATIDTPSSTPKTESSTTPESIKKTQLPEVQESVIKPDPNTAVGSFILEDPAPQTAF